MKMKRRIYFIGLILILLSVSFTFAEEFGYNLLEAGENLNPSVNYSIKNVNSSEYWDNLDTPSDINHNDLSNLAWSAAGHTFDTNLDLNGKHIINVHDISATDVTVTNDLLLSSANIINWNSGEFTLTHSADTLTYATTDNVLDFNISSTGFKSLVRLSNKTAYVAYNPVYTQYEGFVYRTGDAGPFGWINLLGDGTGDSKLWFAVAGDTYPRLKVSAGGVISFGVGANSYVTLYNDGSDGLQTDDDFTAETLHADNGWSGTFTNGDGDTVTVIDGIITNVA